MVAHEWVHGQISSVGLAALPPVLSARTVADLTGAPSASRPSGMVAGGSVIQWLEW
jgi:hypothetical protein